MDLTLITSMLTISVVIDGLLQIKETLGADPRMISWSRSGVNMSR